MDKCPKCGAKVNPSDKRCSKCGSKLDENKNSLKLIIAIAVVIVIIAIVGVFASGIFSNNSDAVDDSQVINPVNEQNTNSSNSIYWASAKSDKFHLPTCEWAKKISDENKIVYHSREEAIADGKEACGVCNP